MYVIAWSISPPLQIDSQYRLLAVACIAVWFASYIFKNDFELPQLFIYSILFAGLIAVIAAIEYGGFSKIMRPISYYMLVLAFILNYLNRDRWSELRIIIPFVLILLTIWNFKTYSVVQSDPEVARLLVRNDETTFDYLRSGVGGYGLLYPQVCIFPMMVAWLIKALKHSKVYFWVGVVWVVSYVLFALNSGYTIAVVSSVVGLIIMFFYKRESITLALVVTLSLIVIIVWAIGYVDGFRNALLDFFDGTKIAVKVNDIYESITTNEVADSISERIERYQASFMTIFGYPLIGGLWFSSGGGHSGLLDSFAKYGIWGGYMFVKMYYYVPVQIKKTTGDLKNIQIANATLVVLILLSLLNSVSYNFVFLVLIVLPILYNDIKTWGGNRK